MYDDDDIDYGLLELTDEGGGWWRYVIMGSNGCPIYGRITGESYNEVYAMLRDQIRRANDRRRAQTWQKWSWSSNSTIPLDEAG